MMPPSAPPSQPPSPSPSSPSPPSPSPPLAAPLTGATTTLAGIGRFYSFLTGDGASARFNYPAGVAIDPTGTFTLVTEYGGHRIRRVEIATGATTTLAGSGTRGFLDGAGASARFNRPWGIAIDPSGTFALVGDRYNHRVRRVDIATGATTTLAGSGSDGFLDGAGGSAQFNQPAGVAIDPSGTFALVAEHGNHRIRRVDLATGATTTLTGSGSAGFLDGAGGSAQFNRPTGIAIDPSGGYALVGGYYNHRIRRVDLATGATTTLAGSGTQGFLNGAGGSAQFKHPSGIAIDPSGGFALVADRSNHRIRRVE